MLSGKLMSDVQIKAVKITDNNHCHESYKSDKTNVASDVRPIDFSKADHSENKVKQIPDKLRV